MTPMDTVNALCDHPLCPAAGTVLTAKPVGADDFSELLWCAHHYRAQEVILKTAGFEVVSSTDDWINDTKREEKDDHPGTTPDVHPDYRGP